MSSASSSTSAIGSTDACPTVSVNPTLFASLSPALQSLILRVDAWLSSSLNSDQLRVASFSAHEVSVLIPSFGSSFALSLAAPHSLSTEAEVLEELESESFGFCFGDRQKERSVEDVLAWVDAWVGKEGGGWAADRSQTPSTRRRKRKARDHEDSKEEKRADVDGGGDADASDPSPAPGASDEDGWDDTASGDGDDGNDGWGDAVEYDHVTSTREYEEELLPPSAPQRAHRSSYAVINKEDVPRLQSAMIQRLSSVFNITSSSATTLLRHCRWDEDDALRRFRADAHALATDAGVLTQLHADVSPPLDPSASLTCLICFDDVAGDRTFALPCGHAFCLGCWREYLRSQIEGGDASGQSALSTRCPEGKCREVLGLDACEMILGDDESAALLSRYRALLLHSFVDDSQSFAWCPAAGCERIVAQGQQRRLNVTCVCGASFCFGCKADAHAPASCSEALQWRARDKGSDNLDTKWILEQSKACPKCGTRTRKEGGCMHVTCTICHLPWCWQCGQSDHHVYDCNRPPWGESKDSTSDLNRYLWYYERYFQHTQSLQITEKALQATQAKMERFVSEGLHYKSTDFLRQAVVLVAHCRQVLAWTYVHAYYVQDDTERQLFEYRQGDLEKMTEALNRLTEEGVEQLQSKRGAVLNHTTALRAFLEGMENDQTKSRVTASSSSKDERKLKDAADGEAGAKPAGKAASTTRRAGAAQRRPSPDEVDHWRTDEQGTIVRERRERVRNVAPLSSRRRSLRACAKAEQTDDPGDAFRDVDEQHEELSDDENISRHPWPRPQQREEREDKWGTTEEGEETAEVGDGGGGHEQATADEPHDESATDLVDTTLEDEQQQRSLLADIHARAAARGARSREVESDSALEIDLTTEPVREATMIHLTS